MLQKKLGVDFGAILKLEPVERAESGRLTKLRIVGEKQTLIVGKELEIRRAFSPSHLYSSAFIIEADSSPIPENFTLHGAGWGHGVGLCQIGAALMAERRLRLRKNSHALLSRCSITFAVRLKCKTGILPVSEKRQARTPIAHFYETFARWHHRNIFALTPGAEPTPVAPA